MRQLEVILLGVMPSCEQAFVCVLTLNDQNICIKMLQRVLSPGILMHRPNVTGGLTIVNKRNEATENC